MRRVVLIDGENFVHLLLSVIREIDPGVDRTALINFPVRQLLAKALDLTPDDNIVYFGTKLKLADAPDRLRDKIDHTRAFQARWINRLVTQDIQFLKAGYLRIREGEPCPKCGHTEPYLLEKGVDVALAVRLVQEAHAGNEIAVVSSDTDLLPAIQVAREVGAPVTYLGFEANVILALSAKATNIRVLTKTDILKLYTGAQS